MACSLPARLLSPWDFPGKNTKGGCHFLLQGSFQPRDQTRISYTGRWILYHWATWEALCSRNSVLLFFNPWRSFTIFKYGSENKSSEALLRRALGPTVAGAWVIFTSQASSEPGPGWRCSVRNVAWGAAPDFAVKNRNSLGVLLSCDITCRCQMEASDS